MDRCGPEFKLFAFVERDRDALSMLAAALAAPARQGGSWLSACECTETLARMLLLFLVEFGGYGELTFADLGRLLGLWDPDLERCVFDGIVKQVSEGVRYDAGAHQWVDDPLRQARPLSAPVREYEKLQAFGLNDRRRARACLSARISSIAADPGTAVFSAGALSAYCSDSAFEEGGCPVKSYGCRRHAELRKLALGALRSGMRQCASCNPGPPPADLAQVFGAYKALSGPDAEYGSAHCFTWDEETARKHMRIIRMTAKRCAFCSELDHALAPFGECRR